MADGVRQDLQHAKGSWLTVKSLRAKWRWGPSGFVTNRTMEHYFLCLGLNGLASPLGFVTRSLECGATEALVAQWLGESVGICNGGLLRHIRSICGGNQYEEPRLFVRAG